MPREAVLRSEWSPRIVVAAGMRGVGVTSVCHALQSASPTLEIVDAGAVWADIAESCAAGCERMLVVTTHDVIAVSSAYALVKLVRDRFPEIRIEVLVNASTERDALKTYERVQVAASHFLGEMVAYAGAVPMDTNEDPVAALERTDALTAHRGPLGAAASMALHDLANRLDDELGTTDSPRAWRGGERRVAS